MEEERKFDDSHDEDFVPIEPGFEQPQEHQGQSDAFSFGGPMSEEGQSFSDSLETDLEVQVSTFDQNHYKAVRAGKDPLEMAIEKELQKLPGYQQISNDI